MRRLTVFAVLLLVFAVSVRVAQLQTPNQAHFHHVHLNVTNPQKSAEFYQQVFGSQPVKFNDKVDALYTSRGFILLNKVERTPRDLETTAIRHIGWAGVDGPNEFAWWKAQGVNFHTPLTALGQNWFFYLYGPDREIAEVYTGDKNHLFNHVHFSATDVAATAGWLERNLGMSFPASAKAPRPTTRQRAGARARASTASASCSFTRTTTTPTASIGCRWDAPWSRHAAAPSITSPSPTRTSPRCSTA